MLKASPDSYGLIAKLFHWVLALVILWQLFTGINLNQMEPSVEKGQFIWIHQITGTFLFCGIALRLLWKFYNRPVFEDSLPKRHRVVLKILQSLLYLICLWLPLQGSMMTWAGGFDVYLVGMIKIPAVIAENKALYPSFVSIHLASSVLLLTLSLIHMGAGLYHGYVIKDRYNVWRRMALRVHRD